ncbi:MAG: Stp1/IreP family PP2C-type Ser/Thr phosphatase [Fuerstia sp.]|nr:Stp1/IreP family PP2C-type Ser/Thr phosphatase [Fuerstiella sp.]
MSDFEISTGAAADDDANTDADTPAILEGHPILAVRSFGVTDTGLVRAVNQDQFLVATLLKALQIEQSSLPQKKIQHSPDRSYLFVVADGMGGHAGGEQASAMAIDSVEEFILGTFKWFAQFKEPDQDQVLTDFQTALGDANARVLAEARDWPELRGMGTTLTLAYSLNDVLFIAHVGDTRCYLCRQGRLYQLTHDHTLVEEMVRKGTIRIEDAAKHHLRHVITNAVGGTSASLKVEVHKLQLEAGDRMLLCSDGLNGMLTDEEINHVLLDADDPAMACNQLVLRANEAGGRDNITVVVADFQAAAPAENSRRSATNVVDLGRLSDETPDRIS